MPLPETTNRVVTSVVGQIEAILGEKQSTSGPALWRSHEGGWADGTDLVKDNNQLMTSLIDRLMLAKGTDDRTAAAMIFWKSFVRAASIRSLGLWARHSRVLNTSTTAVAWHTNRADLTFARFGHRRLELTVLPDDPLAGENDVTVVEQESDLVVELARTLVDNQLGPALTRLQVEAPIATHGAWALAVAIMITALADGSDSDHQTKLTQIEEFTRALPAKLQIEAVVAEIVDSHGNCEPFALRQACCLAHKVRDGARRCTSCSLHSDQERTDQLAASGVTWRYRDVTINRS